MLHEKPILWRWCRDTLPVVSSQIKATKQHVSFTLGRLLLDLIPILFVWSWHKLLDCSEITKICIWLVRLRTFIGTSQPHSQQGRPVGIPADFCTLPRCFVPSRPLQSRRPLSSDLLHGWLLCAEHGSWRATTPHRHPSCSITDSDTDARSPFSHLPFPSVTKEKRHSYSAYILNVYLPLMTGKQVRVVVELLQHPLPWSGSQYSFPSLPATGPWHSLKLEPTRVFLGSSEHILDFHCWEMNDFVACVLREGTHLSLCTSKVRENE